MRSEDGHAFQADYYAQAPGASGHAILVVPDLGGSRKTVAELSARLQGLGYRVLAMDNSGQMRSVKQGGQGLKTFAPIDSRVLERFVTDVAAAQDLLMKQPGVTKPITVVGYGIGANLALDRAGDSDQIGAVALVRPGFGCAEVDEFEAMAELGRRPAILIESQKKFGSDLSRAFWEVSQKHTDLPREQIVVPRAAPGTTPAGDSEAVFEDKLVDWLTRLVPPAHK